MKNSSEHRFLELFRASSPNSQLPPTFQNDGSYLQNYAFGSAWLGVARCPDAREAMPRRSLSTGDVKFGAIAPVAGALPLLPSRHSKGHELSQEVPLDAGCSQESDLGEPRKLNFHEMQRKSAKLAEQLKGFLKSYQKPSLALLAASKKVKAEAKPPTFLFNSGNDLDQLLRAVPCAAERTSALVERPAVQPPLGLAPARIPSAEIRTVPRRSFSVKTAGAWVPHSAGSHL
eukprot:Skav214313  [mRNA]  locus=scaffold998:181254:192288:+ [translate_table: standard]